MFSDDIVEALKQGGVGVIPTDTLYGLVASALDVDAVSRVYELKRRDPRKPLIVLVGDIEDIERFGVVLSDQLRAQLDSYWPGPYSILLPVIDDTFEYLHRGTDAIAFRIPDDEELRSLLRATGPLVAPSANIEGDAPAQTVSMAQRYFGTDADFYIDGGMLDSPPSTIVRLNDGGEPDIVRGAVVSDTN